MFTIDEFRSMVIYTRQQLSSNTGIPISRTSRGNENWLEKSGVRNIGGKITVKKIQGKRLLLQVIYRFFFLRNWGFEKSGFPCICIFYILQKLHIEFLFIKSAATEKLTYLHLPDKLFQMISPTVEVNLKCRKTKVVQNGNKSKYQAKIEKRFYF